MATGIKANAIYRVISQNCWMVPSDSSNQHQGKLEASLSHKAS